MSFLVAAYAIVLGAFAGYALWLARRRGALAARLRELRGPARPG